MGDERWLITGASGQLGGHVVRRLAQRMPPGNILAVVGKGNIAQKGVTVRRVDLANRDAVRKCVHSFRPTHVLHLGGITAVGEAYTKPELANRINVAGTRDLAECVAASGGRLVYSSTDMVFDGANPPYRETDTPNPMSHYGRTKAAAERIVAGFDHTLVVRLPLMYGFPCTARQTTFVRQIESLRRGESLKLFIDEFRTPVWLGDAAEAIIALAQSDLTGVLHVAGPHRLSRYEMIEQFARVLGVPKPNLEPISRLSITAPEPRPADLSLVAERFAHTLAHLVPGPIRGEAFAVQH